MKENIEKKEKSLARKASLASGLKQKDLALLLGVELQTIRDLSSRPERMTPAQALIFKALIKIEDFREFAKVELKQLKDKIK